MPDEPQRPELDEAFTALERFQRGDDPAVLAAIEHAVREVHGNAAARTALEQRLAGQLDRSRSDVARRFVCRELAVIGSALSVPPLAALLTDDDLSHMARYALERIPGPEADRALRDVLGRTKGDTRIGIIHSIAVRRDTQSVPLLARLLAADPASAAAAAKALGDIGTPEATHALEAFRGSRDPVVRLAVADALLVGAERLVDTGERARAVEHLRVLADDASQPPHVRAAANRALSAAMRAR